MISSLYGSKGNTEKSVYYGKKALSVFPDNIDMLNNMGFIYLELKDYPNALNYFDQVIAKDPLYAYAYNNKGYVMIQEGNYSTALEAVQKSLKLDNNNAYAYRNMAICYANMGDKVASCEALVAAGKVEYGLRIKEELEDLKAAYCQ